MVVKSALELLVVGFISQNEFHNTERVEHTPKSVLNHIDK